MTDLEKRLSEGLKSMGMEFAPENEAAAAQQFVKAARRNRILYPVVAFAAAAVLVGGVVFASQTIFERSAIKEPAPRPPAGEQTQSPYMSSEGFEEGFALWPEAAPSEVKPDSGEGWRKNPYATARRFAKEVIGWQHFDMSTVTPLKEAGPVSVRIDSTSNPSNGLMDIYLDEVIGDGRWSVTGASDPRMKITGLSMQIDGRKVILGFASRNAASVLVRMGYGGQPTFEDEVTSEWVVQRTFPEKLTEPGHFLMLRKDERGRIYSVMGGTLPAHDIVAG